MKYISNVVWSLISFCITIILKPSISCATYVYYKDIKQNIKLDCFADRTKTCNGNNNCHYPELAEAISSLCDASKKHRYKTTCNKGQYVYAKKDATTISSCATCPNGGFTAASAIYTNAYSVGGNMCCHNMFGYYLGGASYIITCNIASQVVVDNTINDCFLTGGIDNTGAYVYTENCYYK